MESVMISRLFRKMFCKFHFSFLIETLKKAISERYTFTFLVKPIFLFDYLNKPLIST